MSDLILIVDDEPVQRRLLTAMLQKLGYATESVNGGEAAIAALTGKKASRISCVVLDLVMPDMDGMAVLETMRSRKLGQPVIVQTAQGGVETAVNAMRAGAIDFVVKPASPERLKVSVQNALKMGALETEIKRISKVNTGSLTIDEIISASPNMEAVKRIVQKASQSDIPVLIEGESGVGKEMIARAIQGMSKRNEKNLVTVNCGALPENLAESILFGHEKGAFTGATDRHKGKFQEADGGTLFLDEVGELPLDLQVKLLRAIQEGEVDPVGSKKTVNVDVRLISATNRDLVEEVKKGNFREDLYYRLNVYPVTVPPLRERKEDIPSLVRHFLARISAEEDRTNIKQVQSEAMEMLSTHDWPGNIRQLENAIFRAVVLCDGDELTIDEFPQITIQHEISSKTERFAVDNSTVPELETNTTFHSEDYLELLDEKDDVISLENAEAQIIRFAIERYNGRMSLIARKLGIGRSTLYRKLRDYGIDTMIDEDDDDMSEVA